LDAGIQKVKERRDLFRIVYQYTKKSNYKLDKTVCCLIPTQNLELIPRKVKPYFNEKNRQNTKESMDFRSYYVCSGLLCKGIPTSIESQTFIWDNTRSQTFIWEKLRKVRHFSRSQTII
jgi:hypothetical protein